MTGKAVEDFLYTLDNGGYLEVNLKNNPDISKTAVSETNTAI